MKKILIIYGSAGDGHKMAAEAVYSSFLELKRDDISLTLIDSLHYTPRIFKYLYRVGYIFLIRYIPTLWGFFYYLLDNKIIFLFITPLRRLNNAFNTKELERFLINGNFDVAISTHFLGTEVICHLKTKNVLNVPLINIVTDFKPHSFWQSKDVNFYVVAADVTKALLVKRGVAADRIKVLGIPVHKKFNIPITRQDAARRLGILPDKFTILVMGGGFGVGPIEETVLLLQETLFDYQIVVVCGHNHNLFSKLELLKKMNRFKKETSIHGFCRNIYEIMTASDIMVSKVGGITLAEALAKALPIITIHPIPGQEMRNAEFLFENNIGLKVDKTQDIIKIIQDFLYEPLKLNLLKANIQRIARPYACGDIVKLALSISPS